MGASPRKQPHLLLLLRRWSIRSAAPLSEEKYEDTAARTCPCKRSTKRLPSSAKGAKKMKTWDDYKNHVKSIDAESRRSMEEIEEIAAIVSSMIERRTALSISQRTLAQRCGLPQSSVARIESFKTTPKIDTLLKLMQPLGLKLQVAAL